MIARRLLVALVALLALVAAACGSDEEPTVSGADTTTTTTADDHDDDGDDHAMFSFGEPADAADADRVVEIEMRDDLRFDPDEIEITEGETVTFRLHNSGKLVHDFTIGDAATQDMHDAEMAAMGSDMMDGHGDGNAVTVQPGETMDLTWHFTEAHDLLFGCHVPGHYNAGMVGTFNAAG